MGLSSRHSALLWREQPQPNSAKSNGGGRTCSIALAAASLIVLVVVVSIAGLALYMGTLRGEPTSPLLVFSCSVKILRGDRFIGNLQEKARRYKNQLEILYQRSPLSPAIIGCNVEKFGNDTQTIYYKITLNKRKIPRSVTNIEKILRDTLLGDALSKKPIFKNIRFDSRSVTIRLIKDQNLYQRVSKPKPEANTKFGEVLKPSTKLRIERPKENFTSSTKTVTKKPEIQEVNVEEDNIPVIQGSFQISKTEADIAVNKKSDTQQSTKRPNLKETAVTSTYYKIAAVDQVSKVPVKDISKLSTTTIRTFMEITTKPEKIKSVKTETVEIEPEPIKTKPIRTAPVITDPVIIDPVIRDPVKTEPVKSNPGKTEVEIHPGKLDPEKSKFIPSDLVNNEPWIPIISKEKSPTYTSFTNPALTYRFTENESVQSTSLMRHPIPINKLSDITETSSISSTTDRNDFVNNVTAFFEILASSLEETSSNEAASQETTSSMAMTSSTTTENFGQGQVEVVEPDDLPSSLIINQHTTKLPLVTLMPVKSNSGIGRPLRKRPSFDVETRSFFKKPPKVTVEEVNIEDAFSSTTPKNNFKIMGMLNFHQETPVQAPSKGIIRNQKMTLSEIDDVEIEKIVMGENSSVTVNIENTQYLTPKELKELSEISRLSQNDTQPDIITNSKAVRASYTINHDGFKVLTKSYNKLNFDKDVTDFERIQLPIPVNITECTKNTIKCGNGQCVPITARCNQLVDCENGTDERNCTCADYLKSQLLKRKICDGVVDCWDFSDENECEWCTPDHYVCANSKMCIDKSKICDGTNDCPLGDDERRCITIAEHIEKADEFSYSAEGFLLVRKYGKWGKICLEPSENIMEKNTTWNFMELGKSVCNAISYQTLEDTYTIPENATSTNSTQKYFKIMDNFQNGIFNSSLMFKETNCGNKHVLKIKCGNLECGTRPQVTHVARIVGGINAGLGSWPWQAALYKEGEFQCGATLLSEKWLISAGHCFYHTMDEHWVARLGTLRRGTTLTSPYEQLRHIVKIILHPDYVDAGFINDISLLKMEFPVTFSDYVRPICLPKEGVSVADGMMCTVIGWGQLFETGRIFPDTLQEVQIPVISTEECRKRTVFLPLYRITDNMFCAGFDRGGRDACLGDSGGGLMCPEDDGRWTLQGVTSNGYGCARKDRPGVYTKVSNYIPWILTNINNQNETSSHNKSVCNGHRCPLGDCLPANRLCNGYIECSDSSDEMHCFK